MVRVKVKARFEVYLLHFFRFYKSLLPPASVSTLLLRKIPEFTLKKKTENNKKTQTYKILKVKTKLEMYASGTCT